ncbi:DNA topoisomerase 3-alpha isoform X2 [Ischnura elegans]|nr:DNA topoisomerase 3-alpha isoform X2 [Ischnura elegans]XP_046401855.1 DNA topoisomerase 3-alpha isoform X2 [Ischnura elegans]
MKVLNVAEKNDAAKNIAGIMSRGTMRRREGLSKFNKIYEFDYTLFGQRCTMVMTSVSGHLLNYEFVGLYRKWQGCSPLALFEAPIMKCCPKDYVKIKDTLKREARGSEALIIWTDCDREGENIGFEVIQVCQEVKPRLGVYRAKFSEITAQSIARAINDLGEPDRRVSNAVDVRQELDLRIGAAFTRFQTLRLKSVFPATLQNSLISYGSCQFPTLGFVVERYKAIQEFQSEKFWKIRVNHTIGDLSVDFSWERVRLMDKPICEMLFEICEECGVAKVEKVQSKPKSNWRPVPLDTVELEKLSSKKLKINAKETMKIAEKLYVQGFISYPRTETNIFPKELNLRGLVQEQVQDRSWGEFAARVLEDGPNPRQGKKTDQAHPPIHPIKHTTALGGNDRKVYELIVRHFLACCSKDAEGMETVVDIDIANEKFRATGLNIIARNYLDVYPYKKWEAKEIHNYVVGQTFRPTALNLTDGETEPPKLLTEADLIALMEKHGIGTDATHADHIETIKSREYVGLHNEVNFMPSHLGMGLVEGYDNMGYPMSKPNLRAELENDLKRICEGTKDPAAVLAEQIAKYKEVFQRALEQASKIDEALGKYFNEEIRAAPDNNGPLDGGIPQDVMPCSQCQNPMIVRQRRSEANGYFVSCSNYPECKNAIWLPGEVINLEVAQETCPTCGPRVHLLNFKFKRQSLMPLYPDEYQGCLGGCDQDLMQCLNINPSRISSSQNVQRTNPNPAFTAVNQSRDSGFHSHSSSRQAPPSLPSSQASGGAFRDEPSFSSSRGFPSPPGGGDAPIVCLCGQNAIKLTVRKPGPNQGRQFYKCSQSHGGSSCDFFMWLPDEDGVDSNGGAGGGGGSSHWGGGSSRGGEGSRWAGGSSRGGGAMPPPPPRSSSQGGAGFPAPNAGSHDDVVCGCGEPARRLTVFKEGPNKGRQFFGCPKPRDQQCGFFKWADENEGESSSGWSKNKPSGNQRAGSDWPYSTQGGRKGNHVQSKRSQDGAKQKRKCGLCREEGHTRANCPFNNQ